MKGTFDPALGAATRVERLQPNHKGVSEMVATRAPTSDRISGGDRRQQPAAAQTVAPEVHHSRRRFHFWRHFLESGTSWR